MRKIFYNVDLQAEFEKKGYIVLDWISPDKIDEIVDIYETLTPDDEFKGKNGRYHCTFIDTNNNYKTKSFNVFKEYCDPLIATTLIDYEILIGNFYVKQPGCGEFQIHQNWNVLDEKLHTSVTIWVPLQDTTTENGTIEVVAGSNKIVDNINTLNFPYFFKDFEQELKEKYLMPIDLKKGQVIIFDDNLIHYSKANLSDSPRKSIQLICKPKEADCIFYYIDPKNKKNIELYETNKDFYLTHNLSHVFERPPLKYLGKIPNKNILLKEKEFVQLLSRGEEIRRELYNGQTKNQKTKSNYEAH